MSQGSALPAARTTGLVVKTAGLRSRDAPGARSDPPCRGDLAGLRWNAHGDGARPVAPTAGRGRGVRPGRTGPGEAPDWASPRGLTARSHSAPGHHRWCFRSSAALWLRLPPMPSQADHPSRASAWRTSVRARRSAAGGPAVAHRAPVSVETTDLETSGVSRRAWRSAAVASTLGSAVGRDAKAGRASAPFWRILASSIHHDPTHQGAEAEV